MKLYFVYALLGITLITTALADDFNSGIVYGKNYAFLLKAPKGWILDNTSGASDGLDAVFYPKGSSWEKGSTVMYANVAVIDTFINKDYDAVLTYDTTNFRNKSPGIIIVESDSILTRSKKPACVFHFSNDRHGNYEAVAYIGERTAVVMFILTSKTKKEFDKYLPALAELTKSYVWMTDKVDFGKEHR